MRLPLPRTWRGRLLALAVTGLVVIAVPYLIFAVLTSGAPPPATLPPPGPSLVSSGGILDGTWSLASNGSSFVGYRIREELGVFPAPDDAVGRTTAVTGEARIRDGVIDQATFTADLTQLTSDQTIRDQVMHQQGLQVDTFPSATFALSKPVDLGTPQVGDVVRFQATGNLTLRGVRRTVSFAAEGRWDGGVIHIAAHTTIRRADFGLSLQGQFGLKVSDVGTIEVQLTFVPAGAPTPAPSSVSPTPPPVNGPPPTTPPTEPPATGSAGLVVALSKGGTSSIYTIHEDGTGLRRLTDAGALFSGAQAAWSPDGRMIAFSRGQNRDPALPLVRIFVMGSDGSGQHAVSRGDDVQDTSPSWSPDSRRIAFVRADPSAPLGITQIYVMDTDGSNLHQLTTATDEVSDSPVWSPDGGRIGYVVFSADGNEDVWTMKTDGTDKQRLTTGSSYEYSPAWSPDGTRIAFAHDGDIWSMRTDGSGAVRLTHGPGSDGLVKWSPDGKHLVFIRDDRVIIMDPDGSDQRRVPLNAGSISSAAFAP
jgi:Tol biopolymer transport system component/polyisoprenoid-binding protein YceI